jgi:hypothetical protein
MREPKPPHMITGNILVILVPALASSVRNRLALSVSSALGTARRGSGSTGPTSFPMSP